MTVTRSIDAETTVATYAFDGLPLTRRRPQGGHDRDAISGRRPQRRVKGLHRRVKKAVANSGPETVFGDGGENTVHFYYDSQPLTRSRPRSGHDRVPIAGLRPRRRVKGQWRILELRNGSNQSTRQFVHGGMGGMGGMGVSPVVYIDEHVFVDINGDPTNTNDCDPDTTAGGETDQDRRYFAHQDRNWNVVAISEYADGVGTDGRIVERYAYLPYGSFRVFSGVNANGAEAAAASGVSSVGNVFAHQGLWWDAEKRSYQNRYREYAAGLGRFAQRDPLGDHIGPTIHERASTIRRDVGNWLPYTLETASALPRQGDPLQDPRHRADVAWLLASLTQSDQRDMINYLRDARVRAWGLATTSRALRISEDTNAVLYQGAGPGGRLDPMGLEWCYDWTSEWFGFHEGACFRQVVWGYGQSLHCCITWGWPPLDCHVDACGPACAVTPKGNCIFCPGQVLCHAIFDVLPLYLNP